MSLDCVWRVLRTTRSKSQKEADTMSTLRVQARLTVDASATLKGSEYTLSMKVAIPRQHKESSKRVAFVAGDSAEHARTLLDRLKKDRTVELIFTDTRTFTHVRIDRFDYKTS